MEDEFSDALVAYLRATLPLSMIMERTAVYQQGGPKSGQVTYNVDYPRSGSPNNQLIGVVVDIDVWSGGPDSANAEQIASAVEQALVNWTVNTSSQGTVRLTYFDRAYMTDEVEELAHITLRFTGRAFRRL